MASVAKSPFLAANIILIPFIRFSLRISYEQKIYDTGSLRHHMCSATLTLDGKQESQSLISEEVKAHVVYISPAT